MSRYIALFLLIILHFSFTVNAETYHKAPALPGDGVYSLLRRYQLDRFSCNHSKFYELNGLKKGSPLKVGKYYFIPLIVYSYNGKTIRSSIGIDNWDLAKRIESYNESMLTDGYRKSSFKNNKQLWVPYHELNCNKPDLPPKKAIANTSPEKRSSTGENNLVNRRGGNRVYPIFGSKYEHTPLESRALEGKVFYIVSGHGGPDPGAIGKKHRHQLCEDEYAYDVSLRLTRELIAHGATAYMIVRDPNDGIRDGEILPCDRDERVWGGARIPRSQKARLTQRSDAINRLYEKHKKQGVQEQYTVVIHVDSRNQREQTDMFFYYHPDSPEGKKLAQKVHKSIRSKYLKYRASGQYTGTVTPRDLHMLRESKTPTVYIELGNIRHPFDQKRIIIKSNRAALGKWLFEGLK